MYDCSGRRYYPAAYPHYTPGMPPQGGMMPMQAGGMPPGAPMGQQVPPTGAETPMTAGGVGPGAPGTTAEESFIENILRFNHGRIGTFYFTYQGNEKWNAVAYRGRVETAGRDHIIISNPETGRRYLLLMSNLDWVEFD
ncbi:MAG: spore coat protein GerQ, partial [Tumebacillaceae bacterium]